MSRAISYVSESGDHYLQLYDKDISIEEIIQEERDAFGEEFPCLYIMNVRSTAGDSKELELALEALLNGEEVQVVCQE